MATKTEPNKPAKAEEDVAIILPTTRDLGAHALCEITKVLISKAPGWHGKWIKRTIHLAPDYRFQAYQRMNPDGSQVSYEDEYDDRSENPPSQRKSLRWASYLASS